jgi:hypothetical protein
MKIQLRTDVSEAEFVVCTEASEPSPFHDNVIGTCGLCGVAVQHRPYIPKHIALTCLRCYEKMHQQDDTVVIDTRSLNELLSIGRNN